MSLAGRLSLLHETWGGQSDVPGRGTQCGHEETVDCSTKVVDNRTVSSPATNDKGMRDDEQKHSRDIDQRGTWSHTTAR
jgi:hypothetical protein